MNKLIKNRYLKKCNRDNMTTFISELRGGKYTQTTNLLASGIPDENGALTAKNGEFCCLGVATITAIDHGCALKIQNLENEGWFFDEEGAVLPNKVRKWLGISAKNPQLYNPDTQETRGAAEWNDTYGLDFNGIADLFEYNYLKELVPSRR